MKTYIIFFTLPDGTEVYPTGPSINKVSIHQEAAFHFKSQDPDDLLEHVKNGFNEAWDTVTGFRLREIWKNTPRDKITIGYREI